MGEERSASGAESKSFFRREWEGLKIHFRERLPLLDYTYKLLRRETSPPTAAEVEEFIASDPVYGPTVRATKVVAKYGIAGSVIGAISAAVFSWKYSRSPHGALLCFGGGAVVGHTFGIEIGNHCLQLYRHDPLAAKVKLLEWRDKKAVGGGVSAE